MARNIALGEIDINRDRIKDCLIQANAYEFVLKLPKGIDELIYDRGQRFSGGEKQKLALARALYNNPKILILMNLLQALIKFQNWNLYLQ